MKKFVAILSGIVMFVGVIAEFSVKTNLITAEILPVEPSSVALAGMIGILSMVLGFSVKKAGIALLSLMKPRKTASA
ncbi:MAG TPA: hypothetical protein VGE18_02165 [Candidatus Paceibacterota bacterium]